MNFVVFCLTGLALLVIGAVSTAVVIFRKLRSIDRRLSLHSSSLNLLFGKRMDEVRASHPDAQAEKAEVPSFGKEGLTSLHMVSLY